MKIKNLYWMVLLALLVGCHRGIQANESSMKGPTSTITLEDVTFTIDKIDLRDEVKPEHPNGYYHYYEKRKGYRYFVVCGMANNDGVSTVRGDRIQVQGVNGGESYEGKLLFTNSDESEFVDKLIHKKSQRFYIIILLKKSQAEPKSLAIFYNEQFEKQTDKDLYDHLLNWKLPLEK